MLLVEKQHNHLQSYNKMNEIIAVVKTAVLFPQESPQGLCPIDMQSLLHLINQNKEFHSRGLMETDTTYKQIIPYVIFTYNDTYFLMQRSEDASEKRLKNSYTLGIGGHIGQEDLKGTTLFEWAQREFYEEVDYMGDLRVESLGIVNDDSNAVGKVHLGLVMLVHGAHGNISVKSELKSGILVPLEECMLIYKDLENWSQKVLNFLLDCKYGHTPGTCCDND